MLIFIIIQRVIDEAMTLICEVVPKGSHGQKKGSNFLNMMFHIVRFLPHLEHSVGNVVIHLLKPGMLLIELIS
jgi:hypothetical protein